MRLIDADALIKAIFEHCRSEKECLNHFWYDENIIALIDNAPTVEYPFYSEAYQTGYEEAKKEAEKTMKKKEVEPRPDNIRPITDTRRYRAELDGTTGILTIYRDDKKGKLTYEDVMRLNIWRWGDED